MVAPILKPKPKRSQLPKLVLFAGYSGSGKTTHCTPILKELGYTVHSSSKLHHDFCDRLVKNVLGVKSFDSYNRACKLIGVFRTLNRDRDPVSRTESSSRKLLIDIAESALVPVFSRGIFINAIADTIIDLSSNNVNSKHAVELFNSQELSLLWKRLRYEEIIHSSVSFNLERSSEKPSRDSRDLLPLSKTICNNGSYEDLKMALIKHLHEEAYLFGSAENDLAYI